MIKAKKQRKVFKNVVNITSEQMRELKEAYKSDVLEVALNKALTKAKRDHDFAKQSHFAYVNAVCRNLTAENNLKEKETKRFNDVISNPQKEGRAEPLTQSSPLPYTIEDAQARWEKIQTEYSHLKPSERSHIFLAGSGIPGTHHDAHWQQVPRSVEVIMSELDKFYVFYKDEKSQAAYDSSMGEGSAKLLLRRVIENLQNEYVLASKRVPKPSYVDRE